MQKTVIIIPCYNEGDRLNIKLFKNDVSFLEHIKFIFVNDGSCDNTIEMLEQIKKDSANNVDIINLKKNKGKAEAIRHAVLACLKNKEVEYLGYFDADLSTPLYNIKLFLDILQDNTNNIEIIAGSRIRRMGADIKRHWFRHVLGRIFASFSSYLLNLPIYDTQCGAKVFTRKVGSIAFHKSFNSKWLFDIEIFARILIYYKQDKLSNKIYEFPLDSWLDFGQGTISVMDFISAPFNLFKLYVLYFRKIRIKNIK